MEERVRREVLRRACCITFICAGFLVRRVEYWPGHKRFAIVDGICGSMLPMVFVICLAPLDMRVSAAKSPSQLAVASLDLASLGY